MDLDLDQEVLMVRSVYLLFNGFALLKKLAKILGVD